MNMAANDASLLSGTNCRHYEGNLNIQRGGDGVLSFMHGDKEP